MKLSLSFFVYISRLILYFAIARVDQVLSLSSWEREGAGLFKQLLRMHDFMIVHEARVRITRLSKMFLLIIEELLHWC